MEALAEELEKRAEEHRQKALAATCDAHRYHHQGAAVAFREAAEISRRQNS